MTLDKFDRLVLLGAASGAGGFAIIWPPLALLFLAAVAFVLAAIIDIRTPPEGEP